MKRSSNKELIRHDTADFPIKLVTHGLIEENKEQIYNSDD
jgi:hypothetical protein